MAASLRVFTYKDGLLARLAHDLRLTLHTFEVEVSAGEVKARFELSSLRVDGVMRDGRLDAGAPSARDREQILGHAWGDVLDVDRYPEALFEGRLGGGDVPALEGALRLRGRSEPQEVQLQVGAGEVVAQAHLVPSRWGIAPFRALGGAIKLEDAIDVELRLPWQGATSGEDWAALEHTWRAGPAPAG